MEKSDLKWKEAIEKVLEEEKKALHYTDIAELISERGYRKSLGATPQDTVSSVLTTDINTDKEKSIFAKVDKGIYILRKFLDDRSQLLTDEENGGKISEKRTRTENNKIINAFGIYWYRTHVYWKTIPDLLGIQQIGASEVNFKDQIGIYLLHDSREIIYVGQAIDQPLGQRLKNHTSDRLSGRWDRFSWFGFYPVNENGGLDNNKKYENISVQNLGDTLEAVLIESIEPRQNRKQGNLFHGLEYLQKEAPEIKKKKQKELLSELNDKL
ncbi:MAG: HTH domain-containing protein [Candidatus Methanoperedens sp.]|nr:HTH domain-containing protein [Candidatus Methanoperedens sp.]